MHTATMSSRGRLTIPARLRKRLRLTPGTKVGLVDMDGKIYVQKIDAKHPSDKNYFHQFAGILPTKGKAVKGLLRERKKEK